MPDIQHFVVLMLENRSFDHIFGYRDGVNGLKGIETNLLNPAEPQGPTNPAIKVSNAEPYSIAAGEGPSHSFNATTTQIFGASKISRSARGKNNGFVKSYRQALSEDHVSNPTPDQLRIVMESFAPGTLPAIESLADEFCVCDHWFCEVPGPTMPNRMFIHMGSSGGYVHNVWSHKFNEKTIYDLLQAAGKSWATYDFDQNEVRQFPSLKKHPQSFRSFEDDFANDVKKAKLPNYSFIIPRFLSKTGPVNSMHGPYDARPADQLVADVYNALRANGDVWTKSVLILTMDEHGGFYDHVIPPSLPRAALDSFKSPPPSDNESWVPAFSFDRLGLRVPTVIASPWIPKGMVDHTQYRHTSVLATVMKTFGIKAHLTNRVKTATTFERILSEPRARKDTPQTIASVQRVAGARTFASGTVQDQAQYGLDSMQQEMVLGVDGLTQKPEANPLHLGNLPETQEQAADFIRRRYDEQFGKRGQTQAAR
jgi:phospholipase C